MEFRTPSWPVWHRTERPYTAGYPEHQDIYLAASMEIDSETGEIPLDERENPILGEGGILIRWEEIEYLEFIEAKVDEAT